MVPDERSKFIADRVGRILVAAMDRNPDAAATSIEEVGTRYGHKGVFGVCCAMAAVVQKLAFPETKRGDGSLTGDLAVLQQSPGAKPDPAVLWAARFVTSYINGDSETSAALFYGAVDFPDKLIPGVISLVSLAGDIAREKEKEQQ